MSASKNEIQFLSFFLITKESSVALSIIKYPNPSQKDSADSRYLSQTFLYHSNIIFSVDHNLYYTKYNIFYFSLNLN